LQKLQQSSNILEKRLYFKISLKLKRIMFYINASSSRHKKSSQKHFVLFDEKGPGQRAEVTRSADSQHRISGLATRNDRESRTVR